MQPSDSLDVGKLEQLLGSRTFGGTVISQYQLRTINALSISLLLLWVFSPLGTQSILRVLSPTLEPVSVNSTVLYQDTELRQGLSHMGLNIVFPRD